MGNNKLCAVGLGGQSVFLRVDHFHSPGETLHATAIYSEPGGKAYNQAVAAARLGAEAVFIGAIGNDENGRECENYLKQEGIFPCLMRVHNCGTAYASILTDQSGENRVTVYRGAADRLSEDYIYSCEQVISDCSIMLLGLETSLSAALAALILAERYHIQTIFNPALARRLDMSLLRRFDIITPNLQEAAVLFSLSDPTPKALCKALQSNGIKTAVVTLGGDGALLFSSGKGIHYPAVNCTPVDTTGAGDCFNGALAAALLLGNNIENAVVFAMNAAALSVTKPHVMTALPSAESVFSAMKANHLLSKPILPD